jgi:two-component system sensor histidine kinase KdpD
MNRSWIGLSVLGRVLSAMIAVVLYSLLLYLLRGFFNTAIIAILYLVPVVVMASLFGGLAGVSASIFSFLIFNFFFLQPLYTFRVAHPQDFLAMFVLLGVAILVSNLMARSQQRLQQVQAREQELRRLYELSASLTGQIDGDRIAEILAQKIHEVFPDAVIEITANTPLRRYHARVPSGASPGHDIPCTRIPLYASKGPLGEICLHGHSGVFTIEEDRLLQTYASQGALALERALLAEIETRSRVLEESDRLKTAILSSVSHELRTPLASIQAAATSLFDPSVTLEPAARQELQDILLEEIEHLTQLVGNLLNMSRLEAGALKLQRQWNSMAEIVDTALRRLRRSVGERALEVNVSEDLPLVSVDSVLMEQVVLNLVRNSLKFAPPHTPITISAAVEGENLRVQVKNRGPHIPEEHLDHIFDKFYTIPGMENRRGTGLGLSICKGIVEAHGGTIRAENLPDGVAFSFTIPSLQRISLTELPEDEESE